MKNADLVMRRHSGGNRSPGDLQLFNGAGFRLSPEWQNNEIWTFQDSIRNDVMRNEKMERELRALIFYIFHFAICIFTFFNGF